MTIDKINTKDYLKTLSRQGSIYYCPNMGNAGDSLIAYATYQVFNDAGISYRIFNASDFDPKGKILIYGGGGNLVDYYAEAREIIKKYHTSVKKLVILPHTINKNEDLLEELGSNVDIIVRELVSYNHVRKHNHASNILVGDDMAFNLNVEEVFSRKVVSLPESALRKFIYKLQSNERYWQYPAPKRMMNNNFLEIAELVKRIGSSHENKVLNCFRTDKEGTDIHLPEGNLDLSHIYAYGVRNEEIAFYSVYRMFKFMQNYQTIRTNRLHLGVAGLLLGKQVEFYPNSYYKNAAVYQFSIKGQFPNVQWMGEELQVEPIS